MVDSNNSPISRYGAFISYSHRDAAFARRLHWRLETYRLPSRLASTGRSVRPFPRRIGPIFRDRVELVASADLTEAVRAAIAQSSHLIVICSPNSAASEWVGREVRLFRELHGAGAILTALCGGSAEDAFHSELRSAGPGGLALSPLAADFRPGGDGRLAFLKVVAALAEVPLDELTQRDSQRRLRRVTAISAASLAGMVGASVLALVAIQARADADAERARGEKVIEFMLTDLRGRLKSVGRLDVLDAVNRGALKYYASQNLAHLPEKGLRQRAALLQAIGQDAEKRSDLSNAQAQFDEAKRTTAPLLQRHPNDLDNIYAHAQSEYWSGFIRWRRGDSAGALAGFEGYSSLARRLARLGPTNADWLMEAGYADSNLGVYFLRQSADAARAEPLFQSALMEFKAALVRRPDDRGIRGQIADGYAWLANAARVRGDYSRAEELRHTERTILQELLAVDRRDFELAFALSNNTLAIGRIRLARGDARGAVNLFRQVASMARRLARADPANMDVAKAVRIGELFEVRAWLDLPMSHWPPRGDLNTLLGDCAKEMSNPDRLELGRFCTILAARLAAKAGKIDEAETLIRRVNIAGSLGASRLSELWLIDLNHEERIATLDIVHGK